MNLQDITAKAWILALFIRDDGERFLLGDGWYDFKDSLQHFQPDNIANDVVELQGADGQLLAGQVRRSGTQEFDGYVGDATTPKAIIETRRRDFLGFFKARSRYKVVYIFPDGTAIQRQRGYLVEPATVQEMWQFFPEYHVALSFESVPYYEYAEDAQGNEIYTHTLTLGAITSKYYLGGAVKYTDRSIAFPAPRSWQPWGSTLQGTPSPSSPAPIYSVTGAQTVLYADGTNLLRPHAGFTTTRNFVTFLWDSNGSIKMSGTASAATSMKTGVERENYETTLPAGDYTFSVTNVPTGCVFSLYRIEGTSFIEIATDSQQQFTLTGVTRIGVQVDVESGTTLNNACYLQIEEGNEASEFVEWTGEVHELNFGKNLQGGFSSDVPITRYGISFVNNADGTISVAAGTATSLTAMSLYGSEARNNGRTFWIGIGTYTLSGGTDNVQLTLCDMIGLELGTTGASGSVTITITEPANVFIRADVDAGVTVPATTLRPQLERGTVATGYTPYYQIVELNSFGGTSDHIYKASNNVDWYIEKRTCKTTLNGTESNWNWNSNTNVAYITCVNAGLNGFDSSTKGMYAKLCDHFQYYAQTPSSSAPDGLYEDSSSSYSKLYFKHSASTSLDAFKTWLGSHPVTVYSVRPSATNILVTNTPLKTAMGIAGVGPSPAAMLSSVSSPGTAPLGNSLSFYTNGEERTIVMNTAMPAYPIWKINGPATAPLTLKNGMTGKSITFNRSVASGYQLVIDMGEQTATVNGVNVISDISGDWVSISNGDVLAYTTGSSTGVSTLEWNGVVG